MKKIVILATALASFAFAATPNPQMKQYLTELQAEAKTPFSAERGKEIFFKQNIKDGLPISCTSCHTTDLKKAEKIKKPARR
jgi:cytochrome c peroxidase